MFCLMRRRTTISTRTVTLFPYTTLFRSSPNEIEITGDDGKVQLLRFDQCIIAAGSQAVKLPMFPWDDPRVMDSTDALQLGEVPKHLLVVGGGIIGLEMATVYRARGSQVTVRSEERRGGQECVSTSRARWSPYH